MTTLNEAILESAKRAASAFSGTVSGTSTTSTLVDVIATEEGVDESFGAGGWIYRKDAALAADRLRRINESGFNITTGAWSVNRLWTNAPAAAEAYQVYAALPPVDVVGIPESWKRLVNRALKATWLKDEFVAGHGVEAGNRRFPLTSPEVTLFAFLAVLGGSGVTVTAPTGWTLVREDNSGTDLKLITYRKRAVVSDPSEFDFTLSTAQSAAAIIAAYVDCNASGPVDTSGVTATTPASATGTAPTITTAHDDELVLRVFAAGGVAAFTPPADHLERADVFSQDGRATVGLMLMDAYVQSAGAAGVETATLSTSRINIGQTIALAIREAGRKMTFAGARVAYLNAGTTLQLPRVTNLPNDDWVPNEQHVRKVIFRSYGADDLLSEFQGKPHDQDAGTRGNGWHIVEANGERYLDLVKAPDTTQDVILEVNRTYPELSADADVTKCPLDLLALRTRYEFFRYLNGASQTRGQYKAEMDDAFADWRSEYRQHKPTDVVVR